MKPGLLAPAFILIVTGAHAEQPCLRMNDIWSWSPNTQSSVIVETRRHDKFKVTLTGVCPAIMQNKLNIVLKSKSNSDLACITTDDDVYVQSDNGSQHCLIAKIEPEKPDNKPKQP